MISFQIKKDGDQFHAYSKELKGCHTFGKTPEEALKNLKETIALYLEDEIDHQALKGVMHKGYAKV